MTTTKEFLDSLGITTADDCKVEIGIAEDDLAFFNDPKHHTATAIAQWRRSKRSPRKCYE